MTVTKTAIPEATLLLKLMGDKTRLTMMRLMQRHECCVCEFVDMFEMSQPAISQHLRKLKDVGLIKEEKRGQWHFYSLNESHKDYPFVTTILEQLPLEDERIKKLEAQGLRITCGLGE